MHFSQFKMFCTICGKQYDWNCNHSWKSSRACSKDCHREFEWRDVLSIMGKEYIPRRKIGLDFGNVIKAIGGPMMEGLKEAVSELKDTFESEIYLISRVDNEEGSKKALQFLRENGLVDADKALFEREHLNFCLLREEKGPIAEKLGLTHFVDDRTECLFHMKTVPHRFALNPTERQLNAFPPDGMTVVPNWKDLLPKIKETIRKV